MAGPGHHPIELPIAAEGARLRDPSTEEETTAMAKIIVSYDDTDNDRDALGLGRALGELGGDVSLAYVRHTQQPDSSREALEEREAEQLLSHGAEALGDENTPTHVVVHASTG